MGHTDSPRGLIRECRSFSPPPAERQSTQTSLRTVLPGSIDRPGRSLLMLCNLAHPVPRMRVTDIALPPHGCYSYVGTSKVLRNVRRGSFPCPSMASGGGLSSWAVEHVGGRDDGGHGAHRQWESNPGAALFCPLPLPIPMLHLLLHVPMVMCRCLRHACTVLCWCRVMRSVAVPPRSPWCPYLVLCTRPLPPPLSSPRPPSTCRRTPKTCTWGPLHLQ